MKRIIPLLLHRNGAFYKTVRFSSPKYLGDGKNIVSIFREKDVDELFILDISDDGAAGDSFKFMPEIIAQSFCPIAFGGGITNLDLAEKVLSLGLEKISINNGSFDYCFVEKLVKKFGQSTISISLDCRKNGSDYEVLNRKQKCSVPLSRHLEALNDIGVGDINLQSMDRDGTRGGLDRKLVAILEKHQLSPILISGGTNGQEDIDFINKSSLSGVCVGAAFTFFGRLNAPLISYYKPGDP